MMSKRIGGQTENSVVPHSVHHTMGMLLVYGCPSHIFPPDKSELFYRVAFIFRSEYAILSVNASSFFVCFRYARPLIITI